MALNQPVPLQTLGWSLGERDTVTDALARAVRDAPDQIYLDFSGEAYTYRQVDELATRFAHELRALGVEAGSCVATFLDNSIDVVVGWFAANKLGAIWVPVNTAYRGEFLRHQVADSGAAVVLCEGDYLERLIAIADQLPELKVILTRGGAPAARGAPFHVAPLDAHRGAVTTAIEASVQPEDIACLIYTSGTTGPSKGCMISHNYACHVARKASEIIAARREEVVWTCLPLFHTSATCGCVLATLLLQGRASIFPKFSVTQFWSEIDRSGARIAKIMASMIPLLANAPDDPAMARCRGQLRAVVGAPFPPDLKEIFRSRFGVEFIASNQYACTEGYLLASVPYGTDCPPGSSGRLNEDFELLIADDEGRPVPIGTPGEILFRPRKPDIMFAGYWRRPEDTRQAWRDLWMHTGDVGKVDEQGWFYFVDRKKDYLRKGGENISSWEMEVTFLQHAAVREVAFHAVSSELSEDEIKITAVLEPGAALTEEELWRWSVERLPHFAVPRYIEFRFELPKNGVGRVLKYQLRADGCTPGTWDLHATDIEWRSRRPRVRAPV